MERSHSGNLAIATFVLAGCLGVSVAKAEAPALPNAAEIESITKMLPATAGVTQNRGVLRPARAPGGGPIANLIYGGWNAEDCYRAEWFLSGGYNYIVGFNTDGSQIWSSNTVGSENALQSTILNACSSGTIHYEYLDGAGNLVYVTNR